MAPCKEQVRVQLEQMQGRLCAYCEGDLDALGQHIEHLWRKRDYGARTFDWTNLFWSCDRTDSCGHYKDSVAWPYDPAVLVNPCLHDPDQFFRVRADGHIDARGDLSPTDRHRAEETLRVLHLNLDHDHGGRSLCAQRRRMLNAYLGQDPDLLTMLDELDEEERMAWIESELAETSAWAFSTIIRHFFTSVR